MVLRWRRSTTLTGRWTGRCVRVRWPWAILALVLAIFIAGAAATVGQQRRMVALESELVAVQTELAAERALIQAFREQRVDARGRISDLAERLGELTTLLANEPTTGR